MTAALLAHQGGWDEILLVLVPIAVFGGLLTVANRRARSIQDARDRHDHGDRTNGDGRPDRPDPRGNGRAAR